MNAFDRALEAAHLITRAEQGRERAWSALRRMRRQKRAITALRDYVAASMMVEEAEIQLLKIKKDIGK